MRAGWTPELEVETRRPDSAARVFIDAEIEIAADARRRRAQWELADGVVLRSNDFPASNVLDAVAETTVAVVANAPAGNELYTVHWSVQITPVIPGGGTNTHVVVVALESNADAAGWVERAVFRYEVIRVAGQSAAVVRWPHETESIRVLGLDNNDEIRLRVKAASGPGGWAFVVHGFNVATNGDPAGGLTYHTGLAVDFYDDGGVALADLITTKIENATSDGYETDLGGPPWVPAQSEYAVAEYTPKDATSGEVVDRFIAFLNPRVDGGQPRTVARWVCQPFEIQVASALGDIGVIVPLASPIVVAAQDGDTAEEIVFDWASYKGGGRGPDQRPRPRGGGGALNDQYRSLWFVWALKADGTPATNVGWGKNSAASSVTSGARFLAGRTVTITDPANPGDPAPSTWFLGGLRNVPRCRIEGGAYPSTATVAFTGASPSRFDLGVTPTKLVQFICRAEVPAGTAATFQVRNDADSGWVTVTDGQTTVDLGLSLAQTRKFQVILDANGAGTQTPVLREFGMRELELYPLHHCARLADASWSVDPLQLVSETTNARIVALRDDLAGEFRDRMTRLLTDYFIGQISLRAWWGTPERPRWLHLDDFLIDDEEFRGPEVALSCLGATCLERGRLPIYDDVTQRAEPLVYANETLKAAYDAILTEIGVSPRFLGPGLQDTATTVSKTITESDAKDELDALCFLDGSARISSQGRIKAVRMFGPKAVARFFSRGSLKWVSTTPGFRQRVPEVRVPWNWDLVGEQYLDEFKATHGLALLRLGVARVDPPALLPDAATRWIASNTLAERVGNRHVAHFGTGLMLWHVETEYPEPQLEPGDCLVVPTDRFAGRDPSGLTGIKPPSRGELWALGVIASAAADFKTFGVWVRSYADLNAGAAIGGAGGGPRGFDLEVRASKTYRRGDHLFVSWVGAPDVASVKVATSTSALPAPGTGSSSNGQVGTFDCDAFTYGQTIYITITPYNTVGGAGVQGPAYQAVIRFEFREDVFGETDGLPEFAIPYTGGEMFAASIPDVLDGGRVDHVLNGDWELGARFWGFAGPGTPSIETGADVYKGAKSLKIAGVSGGVATTVFPTGSQLEDFASDPESTRVHPFCKLVVRCAGKVSNVASNASIVTVAWLDEDGNALSSENAFGWSQAAGETTYSEKAAVVVAPAGAYYARVLVSHTGAATGNAWVDELHAILVPAAVASGEYDLGNKGANFDIDLHNGDTQRVRLTASIQIGTDPGDEFTHFMVGARLRLRIVQDGTGGRTPTFPDVAWGAAGTPSWNTAANAENWVELWRPGSGTGGVYGRLLWQS